MKYRAAGKTFASYEAAAAAAGDGEVQIWDASTRGWREVAACEANDDEDE